MPIKVNEKTLIAEGGGLFVMQYLSSSESNYSCIESLGTVGLQFTVTIAKWTPDLTLAKHWFVPMR